jgi:hypothetical protein
MKRDAQPEVQLTARTPVLKPNWCRLSARPVLEQAKKGEAELNLAGYCPTSEN